METKSCRKCHIQTPLELFPKRTQCRDGHTNTCKKCMKIYRAAFYVSRTEFAKEYSIAHYHANKEAGRETRKRYAEKNKEKLRLKQKQWREKNRESISAKKKEDYVKNKGKYTEKYKSYGKAHPEYNKASTLRRRARLKQAPGNCTGKQWLAKCVFHGWRCYLCHTSLTMHSVQMDHRKSIARGGSNWPANLAPACQPCNRSKSDKTEAEFRDYAILCQMLAKVSSRSRVVIA